MGAGCRASGRAEQPETELPTEQLRARFRKLRRRIRKHVEDRQRRAAALAQVDRIDKQLESFARLLIDWRTDLALLPDEQRWDRAAMEAVTRDYAMKLDELARSVGQQAFALRGVITTSEWPRVFPSEEDRC